MKWTYSIENKMAAAFVLLILCVLVLLSSYNDKIHTREVKESISTLYEDRLVAQDYILKLTDHFYQINETLNNPAILDAEQTGKVSAILFDIEEINTTYEKTKLTENEEIKFKLFKKVCQELAAANMQNIENKKQYTKNALALLRDLSAIQIEESKLIVSRSERLYQASKISSDLSIGIVVVLLIILQALVFASKTFHISNKNINLN